MSIGYGVNLRLLAAFRFLLVPLVRILVRNGITVNETYEVLKGAYARVAATDLVPPGQRMSFSRISISTGLPRKEIVRVLRNEERLRRALESNARHVANVLQGWHNDVEFLGPYGVPRELALRRDGTESLTFGDLVARYAADLEAAEVLAELVRADAAVISEENGMIRVLKRSYVPEQMAPELVEIFARGVRRYVETVDHNLAQRESEQRRFERWVFPDYGIKEQDWVAFSDLVRSRLQDVIEDLETKFALLPRPREGDSTLSVGVGLYVYKDELSDDHRFQEVVTTLLAGDSDDGGRDITN